MEKAKTIKVLNTLIEINNCRIEAYETASRVSVEHDLKTLFENLVQTSHKCTMELESEIVKLSGKPKEGISVIGKFFRIWMDIKVGLAGKIRKNILNSCEYGENLIIETYKIVLENDSEYLTLNQVRLIQAQLALIKADYKKVKSKSNAFEVIA